MKYWCLNCGAAVLNKYKCSECGSTRIQEYIDSSFDEHGPLPPGGYD